MLPNGPGVQTNITQSSNLNLGVYNVSCNSTWNSTLASKIFTIATVATTTTVEDEDENGNGGTTITTVVNTTTTTTSLITTISATTTTNTTIITTTTIPEGEARGIKPWYVILIIAVFIALTIAIWYFKYVKKATEEAKFEQLKEKWNR
jgi:magnesium-transporting ATPase (P-type)